MLYSCRLDTKESKSNTRNLILTLTNTVYLTARMVNINIVACPTYSYTKPVVAPRVRL